VRSGHVEDAACVYWYTMSTQSGNEWPDEGEYAANVYWYTGTLSSNVKGHQFARSCPVGVLLVVLVLVQVDNFQLGPGPRNESFPIQLNSSRVDNKALA